MGRRDGPSAERPRRPERPGPGPGPELKGGGWPEDEELPLDPDECVALVQGIGVVPRRPLNVINFNSCRANGK